MLAAPVNIRAITIVMGELRAWIFDGLAAAALLVEPGPSMLVSGMTSPRVFRTSASDCAWQRLLVQRAQSRRRSALQFFEEL